MPYIPTPSGEQKIFMRIRRSDQQPFLLPAHVPDFFFSRNGMNNVRIVLEIDELVTVVFSCECFRIASVQIVLFETHLQIIRDAGVEHCFSRICCDINVVIAFAHNYPLLKGQIDSIPNDRSTE